MQIIIIEYFKGPAVGIVPILICHISFSMALVQQQQHHLLVSMQSCAICIQVCHRCYISFLMGMLLQSLQYISSWMTSTRIIQHIFQHSSTSFTFTSTESQEHTTVFIRCVFNNHSITTHPCCALVLSTINNAINITITNNTAENYATPFDGDMYLEYKFTSMHIPP